MGLGFTGTKLAVKLKIQAKMMISILENGPLYDLIFVWELQRAWICSVWLVNFFERAVAVKEVCLIMVAETMFFQISQVCKVFFT